MANIADARREALLNARDMLIRILKTDEPVPLDDSVDVADGYGFVLHTVTLRDALG